MESKKATVDKQNPISGKKMTGRKAKEGCNDGSTKPNGTAVDLYIEHIGKS